MLLMAKKWIKEGICHSIYQYARGNNKKIEIKDYDKNKKSSYLQYWAVNNLYRWGM